MRSFSSATAHEYRAENTPRTAESTIRCHIKTRLQRLAMHLHSHLLISLIFNNYSVLIPAGCRKFPNLGTPLNYRKLLTL